MFNIVGRDSELAAGHFSIQRLPSSDKEGGHLSWKFGYAQTGICAPEAETVGQCSFYVALLRLFSNIVAIKVFSRVTGLSEIECWWKGILIVLANRAHLLICPSRT